MEVKGNPSVIGAALAVAAQFFVTVLLLWQRPTQCKLSVLAPATGAAVRMPAMSVDEREAVS